jgi:glucuronate isomerase
VNNGGNRMDNNFLLNTPLSKRLYHECAKNFPLIDYHNHLCVDDFRADRKFSNLAELWIVSDPYKHRAMRICGVEEKYITGEAEDYEKFKAWMSVIPKLIGNPLYDWSILEIKRIFGIELNPEAADYKEVWDAANKKLAEADYSALGLLSRFNVEYSAPCASVTDDISPFLKLKNIAPSLRGDNIVEITSDTVKKLASITKISINTLDDFFNAISKRLDDFHTAGCKFSDHALDNGFIYLEDDGLNERRFEKLMDTGSLNKEDAKHLASEILRGLAAEYAKRGWTIQLHIGAQRYTSTRLRTIAGPAGGFAGIGNCCDVISLTQMLDNFEKSKHGLPRTLLFALNPADNAVMSVLSGSYSQDGIAGKVQQGPAWWWCDHLYGMREVFENISTFGVLSVFLGMTTDSRSILSLVRHEYFRRAFCGWIGEKAHRGEMPNSFEVLEKLVSNVCYNNAKMAIGGLK